MKPEHTTSRLSISHMTELDTLSLIFKRCLKDSVFRQEFLNEPIKSARSAGYQIGPDDLTELKALAQKVRESVEDFSLPEQASPTHLITHTHTTT